MTPLGMYRESGDPFAYDGFARYYVTGMLHFGYDGKQADLYREACWRGAWTSLMIQSPFGEMPIGYRSSQHLWNEGELAATYEMYAAAYAKAGKPMEAGAFKRGARLALQSVTHWLRPDGSGYIVKNRYAASTRHGYEGYGHTACYNLLACSMLAAAWSVADESIAEKPAPADLGGFAIDIPEFNMVIANADGAYVEYMTLGNQHYDPTGLIRIHLRDGYPQLGPSGAVVENFGGKPVAQFRGLAVGPAWQNPDGTEIRLANLSDPTANIPMAPSTANKQAPILLANPAETTEMRVQVLEQSPGQVSFQASVNLENAQVTEIYVLANGGVKVTDLWDTKAPGNLAIYYPALTTDGEKETKIDLNGNQATLTLGDGRGVRFQMDEPANAVVARTGEVAPSRNGMLEALAAKVPGNKAVYEITPVQPGASR